jgi:cytochrome P450
MTTTKTTDAKPPRDAQQIADVLRHGRPLAFADPYSWYEALREIDPVYRAEDGLWLLSSYEGVSKAMRHRGMSAVASLKKDPRFASSETLQTLAEGMLFIDDAADHMRQRRLVSQAFSANTVQGLRPWVTSRVSELLDERMSDDTIDFMGDFVDELPVAVICRMLGVPDSDIEVFKEWNFLITTATGISISDDHMAKVDQATVNLLNYLGDLLDERAKNLGDDVYSGLITARDQEDKLSREETMGLAFLLLVAGSDTTSAFIGGAMAALLKFPDQLRLLKANRNLMANAIEELMRYEAPVHFGVIRTTTEPLVIGEVEIGVGEPVWTLFSGANRDPARFPEPNVLDLQREDTRHMGFGFGMHACLGAVLGRMETDVVLNGFFDRVSEVSLVSDQISWIDHSMLRTIDHLDLGVKMA